MSHGFCASQCADGPVWPQLGLASWNGQSIYIRVRIDDSVSQRQACAEAITRWNDAVGSRLLFISDRGDVEVVFYERNATDWPFTQWLVDGQPAGGFALNYDPDGQPLSTNPGKIARSEIYVNREQAFMTHELWVHVYAHEIGHVIGLADHPHDDVLSVMSYQTQGRALLGPSLEDQQGIARIYNLGRVAVYPEDLVGVDEVEVIRHYDRYGELERVFNSRASRWRIWSRSPALTDLRELKPWELYQVKTKGDQPVRLGLGRFDQLVSAETGWRWIYR